MQRSPPTRRQRVLHAALAAFVVGLPVWVITFLALSNPIENPPERKDWRAPSAFADPRVVDRSIPDDIRALSTEEFRDRVWGIFRHRFHPGRKAAELKRAFGDTKLLRRLKWVEECGTGSGRRPPDEIFGGYSFVDALSPKVKWSIRLARFSDADLLPEYLNGELPTWYPYDHVIEKYSLCFVEEFVHEMPNGTRVPR